MNRPNGSAIAADSRKPAVTRKMLMPASLSNPPSETHRPNRRTTAPGLGKNKGSTNCNAVTAHHAAIHRQKLAAAIDQYSFRLSEPRIVQTGDGIRGLPDRCSTRMQAAGAANNFKPRLDTTHPHRPENPPRDR